MIKGMTGFGNAQLSAGKVKGVIEIKSQNHRYFDIAYYLPIGFGGLENKIRQLINKNIKRGRVIVSLKITEKPHHKLHYNRDVVQEYLRYSKALKKEYGLNNNLQLSDLIKLPGVVETKEEILNAEKMWPFIEKAINKAMSELSNMRKREGKSLENDTAGLLRRMALQIKKIRARAKVILKDKKKKLTLDEYLTAQKSSDVSEEITRLIHYIDEFKLMLKSNVDVGKKLDFVAQEMQRETNTIGSKLQDKIVSNSVIALKSKIEKLREQAQNIE